MRPHPSATGLPASAGMTERWEDGVARGSAPMTPAPLHVIPAEAGIENDGLHDADR